MMNAENSLTESVTRGLEELYGLKDASVVLQKTRKEFDGDFTLVTFPFVKPARKSPEQVGKDLGEYLVKNHADVSAFNVVKGFLNIVLGDRFWMDYFNSVRKQEFPGHREPGTGGKRIMLEYASPNTNKPLHLGHLRNILLGSSVANILEANGHKVIRTNLVNDRGIHICKSMLAWKKFGNGETPESSGMKGDHLVGKYYVAFDKAYKQEQQELIKQGKTKEEAEKQAPLMIAAQDMLRKWEAGDTETVELWKMMNSWVYAGFDETYHQLGVAFDRIYHESETYLSGKEIVNEGLQKKVFYKKENGSVAIDLSGEGLDEKVVLRSDGTSVYITQDLGTAIERFKTYDDLDQLIYTVGNEQDYHFKVLFLILEKLGYAWARGCYHLSYGMVELPDGKMKSREGTVVDADELLDEMYKTAEATTRDLGKIEDFSDVELKSLFRMIGLGALKYFILKVDPKKKMLFNPKESIDFNGHTGPFIQYTHARIRSVLRRTDEAFHEPVQLESLNQAEREVVKLIYEYGSVVKEAGDTYSPALVANHLYELTKSYNRFYHDHSILKEEDAARRAFRLQLSRLTGRILKAGMDLLGISVPERM